MNYHDRIDEISERLKDTDSDEDIFRVISSALDLLLEMYDNEQEEEMMDLLIKKTDYVLVAESVLPVWGIRLRTERAEKFFLKYDIDKLTLQHALFMYLSGLAEQSSEDENDSSEEEFLSDSDEDDDEEDEREDEESSSISSPPKRPHSV